MASIFDLFKSAAEKSLSKTEGLYKKAIRNAFEGRGLWKKGFKFEVDRAIVKGADDVGLGISLKNRYGEEMFGISRRFNQEGVGLDTIDVAESFRRRGIAKEIYHSELDIFRKIGYKEGDKVESPVVSAWTEKLQRRIYGSEFTHGHYMEGRIPGKDDAYNTIEGLSHKGIAQKGRKKMTAFGSGFDAARSLVLAKETFTEMLESKGFQKALSEAKPLFAIDKTSQFGKVSIMETSFRGQKLKFARKTGEIGEFEAKAMRELQDKNVPSLYGQSGNTIDMEYIEGRTFADIALSAQARVDRVEANPNASRDLISSLKSKNDKIFNRLDSIRRRTEDSINDWDHGDLHMNNIIMVKTPQGRVPVLIDFGQSSKRSAEQLAVERKTRFIDAHAKSVKLSNEFTMKGGKGHLKQTGKNAGG